MSDQGAEGVLEVVVAGAGAIHAGDPYGEVLCKPRTEEAITR